MDTSEPQDLHRSWLHQTLTIFQESWNQGARRGHFQGVGSSSEGHDAPRFFLSPGRDVERSGSLDRPLDLSFIERLSSFAKNHDQRAIVARSPRDRCNDQARSWPHLTRNHSHNHHSDHGHQFHPTTALNGQKFRAKFFFKKRCILPLKLNF